MNAPEKIIELGGNVALPGLDAATYHAAEALSGSGAKQILKSPAHFRLSRDKPKAPTDNMQFGTVVHTGVLEPDTFDDRVVVAPDVNKRTKDGRAEFAAFEIANAGRIVLSREDYDRALACVYAVRSHPTAQALIAGGTTELSLFWTDRQYGVPCKSRYDVWNHGGCTDLKTCIDASPDGFSRAIGTFGYHTSAAFYLSGGEHVFNATPEFFAFVCVESEPPHAVACYALDRPSILAGINLCDEALRRYKRARELGVWEGYASTVEPINAPKWALRNFY